MTMWRRETPLQASCVRSCAHRIINKLKSRLKILEETPVHAAAPDHHLTSPPPPPPEGLPAYSEAEGLLSNISF